jgi:hypothetical protein
MQNQENGKSKRAEVTRREFLSGATITLLMIPVAGAVSRCGSSNNPSGGCDGAGATSTVAGGHTHTICVALADLSNPPAAGKSYTSSLSGAHSHTVTLTQAQLQSIASGQPVTVTTSTDSGHAHDFALQKSVSTGGGGGGNGGYGY